MTNALKEIERKAIERMSLRSFWDIRHDTDWITLRASLARDGRYYSADYEE